MKMPAAFSYFMLDRTAVLGGSYENASGIFMRRACCEMHHYCFHIKRGGQTGFTEMTVQSADCADSLFLVQAISLITFPALH